MLNSYSSINTGFTRRDMIKTMTLGTCVCALPGGLFAANANKIGLSVQLYSVRNDCGKNFNERKINELF